LNEADDNGVSGELKFWVTSSGKSSVSDCSLLKISGVESTVKDPGNVDLARSRMVDLYSSTACLPRALTLSVRLNSSSVSSSLARRLVVAGMMNRT
jgi:hypothetical protein